MKRMKRQPSKKRNSSIIELPYRGDAGSKSPITSRSPLNMAKKQFEKEGMVVESVSYLQQIFIKSQLEGDAAA